MLTPPTAGGANKNPFCFRDLFSQLEVMNRIGSMDELLSLMPGFGKMTREFVKQQGKRATGGSDATATSMNTCNRDAKRKTKEQTAPTQHEVANEAGKVMRKFLVIMDSMCSSELDNDASFLLKTPNRLNRIARGAGVDVAHVKLLCDVFTPLKDGMGMMRKTLSGKAGKAIRERAANPSAGGNGSGIESEADLQSLISEMIPKKLLARGGGGAALRQIQAMMPPDMLRSLKMDGGGSGGNKRRK
jgi:signal recognition particle GTPase